MKNGLIFLMNSEYQSPPPHQPDPQGKRRHVISQLMMCFFGGQLLNYYRHIILYEEK